MMEKILQSSFRPWFDELISQRLSAKPKGNSMKYAKQGPREFLPFEYSEVTLENNKRFCKVHYWQN